MAAEKVQFGSTILEFEDAKRGGIRWAVGQPGGPRSSTWRLWANKKGDVYLAARSLGGVVKTSFHRDGNCYTGFTSSYEKTAKQRFPRLQSRHWEWWKLPDAPIVRAVQIVVPASELRTFDSADEKQMKWLPAPSNGWVSVVSVFIAKPNVSKTWPGAEHGAQPIGIILTPLRTTWAVFARNALDAESTAEIEKYRAELVGMPGAADAPRTPGVRAILCGFREAGHRFFLELAWGETGGVA